MKLRSFILFSILGFSAFAQSNYHLPNQVSIANGKIEGYLDTKSGIQFYLGIPFAKPPVGPLRWKAPQNLENWTGVKQTKKFGPRPVQTIVFGDMNSRSEGLSEDCLYLNVWTPAKRTDKNLPVLLYYYGGGNVAGDGSEPRYDGESMAKKGIVVVTCNYRLNIFGFLAHAALSKETTYKGSGNYGLMDQAAALQWVSKNIAAFGGDPKKITLAGESAGSYAVSYQMASPLARNLVAGAIGESGSGMNLRSPAVPMATAEKAGEDFLKAVGISSIAQMRALSTKDLFEIYTDAKAPRFPISIDNYVMPKTMLAIFAAKEQAQVPLLLGWNSAEIGGAGFLKGQGSSPENFISQVKKEFPQHYEAILNDYPHANEQEVLQAATDISSDRFIVYSTWKWFDMHRKNSSQSVYRYLYSKLRPPLADNTMASGLAGGTVNRTDNVAPPAMGAPHACEIEYCMGNLPLVKEYAWTADDYLVSETMQNYFANFIKTGNPNGAKLPEWEAAKPSDPKPPVMVLNTNSALVRSFIDGRFETLEKTVKP